MQNHNALMDAMKCFRKSQHFERSSAPSNAALNKTRILYDLFSEPRTSHLVFHPHSFFAQAQVLFHRYGTRIQPFGRNPNSTCTQFTNL